MSKITFCMLPEPGHFLPTLRIADHLQRKGHTIEYLTISDCAGLISGYGFGVRNGLARIRTQTFDAGNPFEASMSAMEVYGAIEHELDLAGSDLDTEIAYQLQESPPELLILDSALPTKLNPRAGATHIDRTGIPIVRISTAFPEIYGDHCGPKYTWKLPELVLCPREFDLPDSPLPPPYRNYAEPSLFRDRGEIPFEWDWLDSTKHLAYCSLGTQRSAYGQAPPLLRKIVEAFSALHDYQLVLATSGFRNMEIAHEAAANVLIVPSAPQVHLLENAKVAITHGGLGTIKECILSATPMIVLPFLHDQPSNAERVVRHGLGIRLQPDLCTSSDLQNAVRSLCRSRRHEHSLRGFQAIFIDIEKRVPSADYLSAILSASTSVGTERLSI